MTAVEKTAAMAAKMAMDDLILLRFTCCPLVPSLPWLVPSLPGPRRIGGTTKGQSRLEHEQSSCLSLGPPADRLHP
jgi:hypothetical protein